MTRPDEQDFAFSFDPRYRRLARPFGITEASAHVRVSAETFTARFGPWIVHTPLSNIDSVAVTGPYRMFKTAGPARLSIGDRGLTFASNAERGVCVRFVEPIRGFERFGLIRHPNLTVTVGDPERLATLLGSR